MSAPAPGPAFPDLFVATFPLEASAPPAQLRKEAAVEISKMPAARGCSFAPTHTWEVKVSSKSPKRVTVTAPARSTRPRAELAREARAFIAEIRETAPTLAKRCTAYLVSGGAR